MYVPIHINWPSSFPILVLLGGVFHFISNLKRKLLQRNSGEPDQTTHLVASDLVLRYLPCSIKMMIGLYVLKG